MKKFTLLFSLILFSSLWSQTEKPKLIVGIVVDQMRYDYLYRFQNKYKEDGFKRLMREGANCRNTHYNYVPTYTAPGHASIYTGATPSGHGIVGNSWYDRVLRANISNVSDTNAVNILTPGAKGRSPKNLKLQSLTDALKLSNSEAKVISVSIKDRGAILPGGKTADAAYWFDYDKGDFTSSDYYMEELPQWLKDFNAEDKVEEYMDASWETYYPVDSYTESRRDTAHYEYAFPGNFNTAFPHDLRTLKGTNRYTYFTRTPFANSYLADLAMEVIRQEKMGTGTQTDFLALSFSSTDIIGHAFGPYSKEIEDCYIRLDRDIAKILKFLDENIGEGEYTLFLTADHAVAPIPLYLKELKMDAGFFYQKPMLEELSAFIVEKYGVDLILSEINNNIYLDRFKVDSLGLMENEVNEVVASFLRKYEGIYRVYTSKQLMYEVNAGGEIQAKVARGYDYHRSGDVVYVLSPNYLAKESKNSGVKGTTHGSPYAYDSHVPLLFYGRGINSIEYLERVEITDICPTICTLLQLQFPNGNSGKVITNLIKK